ncbi:hypothetical protein F66182_179 [Fusarium sp. NRRL 66182]|nr:hypothetical protein F66182_179 [Fusarium sp. NRRL 66182]
MPGLIRRLIAPQRSQPNIRHDDRDRDRNDHLTDSCEDLSSCCTRKSTSAKTRNTSSRLPVPKKKSIGAAPVTIQRVHEVHRVANPVPPLPPQRIRAPSVSSSRYEARNAALEALTGNASNNTSTNRRAATAPVLCPTEHGPTHPHSSHHSHSTLSSRYLYPPPSRTGSISPAIDTPFERNSPEALTSLSDHGADDYQVGPADWQSTHGDAQSPGSSSDSVDRLFRETDEAFKALGSALRNTQRASQTSVLPPSPPSPPGIPKLHQHSKSMPLPTGLHKHSRWRGHGSPSNTSQRSSIEKRASVAKKPPKKKQHLAGRPFSKPAIRAPRWTLSENVTDILTGQRFRRIQADEMLTPDRIEALRKKREAAQRLDEERTRHRYSIDSVHSVASDNSETDMEPFHLDELASRIRARQAMESSAVAAQAALPALDQIPDLDLTHRDVSKPSSVVDDDESVKSAKDKSDASADSSPQLPPKNPARFAGEPHQALPSIPEVMVTSPNNKQQESVADGPAPENIGIKFEENDEFFYLKSTPYTLTKPSFRHGPITLSKAEVGKGVKTMDDTLDWTAFQMAILGGAGDLFPDMSNEEDTKQVEEITSWFDTFGFETYGVLIPEDEPPPTRVPSMRSSSRSTLSVSSTPSTIDTDVDLPIPVGAEFPSGFWNAPANLDKAKFFNSTGLKRWVGEGGPKRPTSHSSEGSLPPSPMMPLVVHGEADTVPMGYNLGHDLGDFLRWEAENAYAFGYSMSP